MPVYNGERYLVDAVASILSQTTNDLELVCINDGSDDRSPQILEWFATQDSRIRVVHQPNCGIVDALNAGCAAARAPLICRMDCDDVALPDRLERQANFMRHNPDCTVVGGAILEIDADSDPLTISRLPQTHAEIIDNLLHRRAGHFHPTTMIRAADIEAVAGYRREFQWVEDHDLWLRLAQRGRLANLPEPVLCYRQHATSVCWQRSTEQRELMNRLLSEAYRARGRSVPASLLLNSETSRSAAGPGKWVRMAARGGYVQSTWKHLRKLHQSPTRWTYRTRMTIEALVRLGFGCAGTIFAGTTTIQVPTFADWHRRLADHQATWQPSCQRVA